MQNDTMLIKKITKEGMHKEEMQKKWLKENTTNNARIGQNPRHKAIERLPGNLRNLGETGGMAKP